MNIKQPFCLAEMSETGRAVLPHPSPFTPRHPTTLCVIDIPNLPMVPGLGYVRGHPGGPEISQT
jgi:hypothetical protein